jgi:hypothetical protein
MVRGPACRVGVDALAHLVQVEGAPARRVVELDPLVVRHISRVRDVGREAFLALQHLEEFVPDFRGGRLEGVQPGEVRAIEEFDRGQVGILVDRGVGFVAFAAAQHHVHGSAEASQRRVRQGGEMGRELPVEERGELVAVLLAEGGCPRHGGAQIRMQALDRRCDRHDRCERLRGLVALALPLQEVGAQDERQEIHRVE